MRYKSLAIVLFLSLGFCFLSGCDKKETTEWKVKDPREEINKHPEPPFVKEGDLTFLKKDGKEIKKIDIEVADDNPQRQQGLMWRKSMPETNGMLFIFPQEEDQSFWMKNTIIPLDIMFLDSNKKIVKIYKNTTPYSETSLPSGKKAMYVIETAAGFCDKYGITEDDKVRYSYSLTK